MGTLPNYTSRTDWSDVSIVNRLSYDAQTPYIAAELYRQIEETTFTGLTIDGYEVAAWIDNGAANTRDQITLNSPAYLNSVSFETWDKDISCASPANVTHTPVSATSMSISWTSNPAHKRYMVRYRKAGEEKWQLATATGTSVTLTDLGTGKTYTYQVVAGCQDAAGNETAPSDYSLAKTFTP